jgi:hypothetical protein
MDAAQITHLDTMISLKPLGCETPAAMSPSGPSRRAQADPSRGGACFEHVVRLTDFLELAARICWALEGTPAP